MVSGKPPRRSKAPQEPVTIDLKAEEAGTAADRETAAETSPDKMDDSVAPLEADAAVNTPDPSAEQNGADGDTLASTATETLDAESAPRSGPEPDAPPTPSEEPGVRPPPVRNGPSASTLVASAILGGLVALALAGSMQYAGVLPTPGPDRSEAQPASADVEALRTQVEQLSADLAKRPSTAAPAASDPQMQERLSALEASVAAQASQPAAQPDTAALDALRAELESANQAIAALKTEIDRNRSSLEDSNQRLADAEKRLEEPRNDVEMARAIALSGLKTAIDRGGPFLSELDALKSIAPDDPTVQALAPIATAGVPSRADLAHDFAPVADAILAAIHAPQEGEGWTDRLLSSARSLVKVRPIGNVEGDTPEALVARIEDKLQNGDLKGAHLEWQALPEAGKAASEDFAGHLEARIRAEDAVGKALARTVAGNEG